MTTEIDTGPNAIELATELTIAWLSNPNTVSYTHLRAHET